PPPVVPASVPALPKITETAPGVNKIAQVSAPARPALPPVPRPEPNPDAERRQGEQLLEQARRELRCGQTALARRLATEAHNGPFGVRDEAAQVLRSIDAEEHNQACLAADRSADASIAAFNRGDYQQARTICAVLDLKLLAPARQNRLKEILRLPEMQPGYQAGNGRGTAVTSLTNSGQPRRRTVGDPPPPTPAPPPP